MNQFAVIEFTLLSFLALGISSSSLADDSSVEEKSSLRNKVELNEKSKSEKAPSTSGEVKPGHQPDDLEQKRVIWNELPSSHPVIEVTSVDSFGKTVKKSWPIETEWVWTKDELSQSPKLALRVRIDLPATVQVKVDPKSESNVHKVEKDQITFDFTSLPSTVALTLTETKANSSVSENLIFSVSPVAQSHFLAVHNSCNDSDIGIRVLKEMARAALVSVYCEDEDEGMTKVFVASAPPYQVKTSDQLSKTTTSPQVRTFEIRLSEFDSMQESDTPKSYSAFKVTSEEEDLGEYQIVKVGKVPSKVRLGMGFGASITYFSYSEPGRAISISEVGITLKQSTRLYLLEDQLKIDGTVFGLLTPASSVGGGMPRPYFIGINGRLGYKLPISWAKLNWYGYAGGYLFKMIVPNNAYGVSFVSGPQMYLEAGTDQLAKRKIYGYLKFAPFVNTDGSLSFSSRELAIGGGFQVSRIRRRPLLMTLDFSQMTFSGKDLMNHFGMYTVSLGVSVSL